MSPVLTMLKEKLLLNISLNNTFMHSRGSQAYWSGIIHVSSSSNLLQSNVQGSISLANILFLKKHMVRLYMHSIRHNGLIKLPNLWYTCEARTSFYNKCILCFVRASGHIGIQKKCPQSLGWFPRHCHHPGQLVVPIVSVICTFYINSNTISHWGSIITNWTAQHKPVVVAMTLAACI